jgi:hypothetical protein
VGAVVVALTAPPCDASGANGLTPPVGAPGASLVPIPHCSSLSEWSRVCPSCPRQNNPLGFGCVPDKGSDAQMVCSWPGSVPCATGTTLCTWPGKYVANWDKGGCTNATT